MQSDSLSVWAVGGIYGALYPPAAWADVAELAIQVYEALRAAANTSSTLETRSSISSSVHQLQWTRRHFSPKELERRSPRFSLEYPRAIAVESTATKQKKTVGKRDRADDPQYDFYAPTVAISCADAVDTPNTTTVDVFNEIIHAATVSQMLGPQWDSSMWCHRCVPFMLIYQSTASLSACWMSPDFFTILSLLTSLADGLCEPLSVIKAPGTASWRTKF